MKGGKIGLIVAAAMLLIAFNSSAEDDRIKIVKEADIDRQISYAIGYDIYEKLSKTIDLDINFFMMGARDGQSKNPRFTGEEVKKIIETYQRIARQKQIEQNKAKAEINKAAAVKFLDENKLKEGIITRSSGLQYRVIKQGKGEKPAATDNVECHYKGSLLDGSVFDSSYLRGSPAVFQVTGVIKAWAEALQLMNVGSKWELFVPPDLAYGDRGAEPLIEPGSMLIFEVELLNIVK